MARRSRITPWLPVLAWVAVIAGLGGAGFEHEQTSRILGPLLRWLLPDWSPERIAGLHGGIRKLAHVAEYAVAALLICRALMLSSGALAPLRLAGATLGLVALVAAADEARQATLRSRTGSLVDFGLDLAGGLTGLAAAPVLLGRLRRDAAGSRRG